MSDEQRIPELEEENRKLKERISFLEERNEHLEGELSMASKLKYHMRPSIFPAFPNVRDVDVYADTLEIKQIGGDYFDFFWIDSDHIGIVVADIFDGGIAASLYMIAFRIYLSTQFALDDSIEDKIASVNDYLCWKNEDDLCLSAWYGRYEISTGTFTCVNAGHERPMLLRDGKAALIEGEKISYLLGVIEEMQYESYEFKINPGEKLLLYTDGVISATDESDSVYTYKRLSRALEKTGSMGAEETVAYIQNDFRSFVESNELREDATFLCFERKEADR